MSIINVLKQQIIVLAVSCVLAGMHTITKADELKELKLTDSGKPAAVIIVSDKPTRSAKFAAQEFQQQIKAITGALLPIRTKSTPDKTAIYIGTSETVKKAGLGNDQFKEQEYIIKFIPNGVILTGLDAPVYSKITYNPNTPGSWHNLPGFWEERGTLHAVYDFLERFCGVRYFNPTEFGTDYPKHSTLIVKGKDLRRTPFFRYRETHPLTSQPERVDEVNIMWGTKSPEFLNWQNEAYPRLKHKLKNQNKFNRAYKNIAYRHLLRSRNGGTKMTTNHSLYPYYAYFWDKSSKNFIKSKPEYFAKGWGEGRPEQMCYTNKELLEQVAKEADNYFKGKDITDTHKIGCRWGKDNFAVVPQDNEFHCRCQACQKLLNNNNNGKSKRDFSTNLMFNFVNKVAKKVKKTNPDKTVSALAYAGYMASPKFPLEDNIAVHFCFDSNRAPEFNKRYQRQENFLNEWAAKKPAKGLYLWLYYCFPHEFATNGNFHCFPAFFAHQIGKQFKLFHKLGIKGMFHCGYGQEVESYITFRLMDDPTLDVNQLLDEYFQRMYGPAAKPMKKIYDTIENIYQTPANHPARIRGAELFWKYQGIPARMKKLQQLCDKAKKLAITSPYKERVALWDKGVWAYMKKGAAMYHEKMSAPMPNIKVPEIADINGKLANVNWNKAVTLNQWFNFGQASSATRQLSAKLAHDNKYLYIELTDPCDTSKLFSGAAVFPADTWELFISKQRGMPYRQYAFGPTGKMIALSHGEVNFRMNVHIENPGIIVQSDKEKHAWRLKLAFPLKDILATKVNAGDKIYLNVIRVASRAVSQTSSRFDMSSLVSHSTVHDPVRAAELTLE